MAIQSGVFITSRTSRSDQKHHRNFYFWPHIFGTAVVAYMSRVFCSYGTAGRGHFPIDHLSGLPFSFLSSSIPETGENHFQRPVPPNNTLGVQFRNPGFKTKAIASARVRGPYRGIISSQVARKDVCQIILSIHRLSLLLISLVCIGIIINCIYPHNTSDLAHRSDVMLMQCYLERRMRKVRRRFNPLEISRFWVRSNRTRTVRQTPRRTHTSITSTTNMLRRWLNVHAVEPHKHPQHRLLNIASQYARKIPVGGGFQKMFSSILHSFFV